MSNTTRGPQPVPVEIRRRKLMAHDRALYDYIAARIAQREWKRAGDTVSGARDGHGAANRCWAESARWAAKRDAITGTEPTA